jgi:hypothetical protein
LPPHAGRDKIRSNNKKTRNAGGIAAKIKSMPSQHLWHRLAAGQPREEDALHWRIRVALVLTLSVAALAAFSRPVLAESCNEINAKITAAEEARQRLRALVNAFAAFMSVNMGSAADGTTLLLSGDGQGRPNIQFLEAGHQGAPAYLLETFKNQNPNFESELRQARQDVAATPESELQRLRALKQRQCSGTMASTTPSGSPSQSGGSFSRYQNQLPQTAYGSPAVGGSRESSSSSSNPRSSISPRSSSPRSVSGESSRYKSKSSKPSKSGRYASSSGNSGKVRNASYKNAQGSKSYKSAANTKRSGKQQR